MDESSITGVGFLFIVLTIFWTIRGLSTSVPFIKAI
jgi:hypothetical protein